MAKTKEVTPIPTSKAQGTEGPETPQRVYRNAIKFDHDLFRLENAVMTRNMSWRKDPKAALWENFDHKHFFHTHDSDGRAQKRAVPVMGHFHPMEIIPQGPGQPPIVRCGPAMKEVMVKNGDGGMTKTTVELQGREQHRHDVTYVMSEELTTRKVNSEAVKAQSQIISKQTPNFTDEERKSIRETSREKISE